MHGTECMRMGSCAQWLPEQTTHAHSILWDGGGLGMDSDRCVSSWRMCGSKLWWAGHHGHPVGWAGGLPWAGDSRGLGGPHCQLAQLSGRLCRMASKFCLSARISASSFSKPWICSSCCSDSCSNSLSFPWRGPGGCSCSLRRSTAHWVSFRTWAGA